MRAIAPELTKRFRYVTNGLAVLRLSDIHSLESASLVRREYGDRDGGGKKFSTRSRNSSKVEEEDDREVDSEIYIGDSRQNFRQKPFKVKVKAEKKKIYCTKHQTEDSMS